MKTSIILVIALCMVSFVQAQDIDISSKSAKVRIGDVDISVRKAPFMQGDWELSMMGSIGSYTTSTTYNYTQSSSKNEHTTSYLFLSFTPGYFFADNFSVEPEITFLAAEKSRPCQSLLLNLSFTYPIENSNIALFLRGGYGLSNATFFLIDQGIPYRVSEGFHVKTINAGIGVKVLITQGAALRLELNYRSQTYTEDVSSQSSSFTIDNKDSIIRGCVGFSILL